MTAVVDARRLGVMVPVAELAVAFESFIRVRSVNGTMVVFSPSASRLVRLLGLLMPLLVASTFAPARCICATTEADAAALLTDVAGSEDLSGLSMLLVCERMMLALTWLAKLRFVCSK